MGFTPHLYNGYDIGKYISLEAKIAKSKEFYYEALQCSQYGWQEEADDPVPFIKYLLGTIISAYRDFEDRIEIIGQRSSIDIVRSAIKRKIGKFRKVEICGLCPSLSVSTIERNLKVLCKAGEIKKEGSGRATYYITLGRIN